MHTQFDSSVWFRARRREGRASLTLVCLPHAGGGASMFKNWQTRLPVAVDVFAVQYPGHEGRWGGALCSDASEIVEPLTRAVETEVETAYALFGHSLGALVAFEVARAMRRRGGREPVHLFVSGSRAPDAPGERPPLHTSDDAELQLYLCRLGGLPDEVVRHPDLLRSVLPMVRVGLRMYETFPYTSEVPLGCPITALAGDRDGEVSREQLAAWARHTTSGFRLEWFPGGHFFVSSAEPRVLDLVRTSLAAYGERRPG